MDKIIVITSSKGGSGSSFCASGVAVAAALAGKNVLLIDASETGRCLDTFLSTSEKSLFDLKDVLNGNADFSSAAVQCKTIQNLSVVSAPLVEYEIECEKLSDILCGSDTNKYDFVIIDCEHRVFTEISDSVSRVEPVIVTSPDPVAVSNAYQVSEKLFKNGNAPRLIINLFDRKNPNCKNIDEIINKSGLQLLGIIPLDKKANEDVNSGRAVVHGKASKAFVRIYARLSGYEMKLPKINSL